MSGVASEGLVLDAGVTDFLERHGAGEAFQTVCALARACFPELRGLAARVQEDPDEPGRAYYAVFHYFREFLLSQGVDLGRGGQSHFNLYAGLLQ
jgi:hypothetical protein